MAQIINTNILSLNAQRNLTNSQSALQVSLQRLSTGLRINSAKDDAAGLAISERFTTQIRGLNQAVRNANDGISLAQTAEGALGELNNNLQRIRELAVQSANATNSSSDRIALDREVQQRLAEIDRIASQTSFNGQKILDGTFGEARFQVGANVGETIDLSLQTSMRRGDIGAVATATSADLSTVITEGQDAVAGAAAVYTSGEITNFNFDSVAGSAAEYTVEGITGQDFSTVNGSAAVYTTDDLAAGDFDDAVFTVTAPDGSAFEVDATGETFANVGEIATFIQGLTGYGDEFTVTAVGDTLEFTATGNADGSFNFGGANAALLTAGTPTDTAGVADDTSANSSFTVTAPGGAAFTVDLNSDIQDVDDLAAAIQGSAGYASAGFTVASDGTTLTFTADDEGAGEFTFGGAEAALITGATVNSTAGSDEDADANATFTITGPGGISENITLDQDYGDINTLAGALGGTGYSVIVDGNQLVFTADAEEDGSFSFGGDAAFITTGGTSEAGATEQAAVAASSVTVADNFTIQIGDADAVAVENGEYTSLQALADAMNTAMGGEAQAQINDDGTISIISSADIAIDGSVGLTDLGFAATSEADGSLATVSVLTVDAANDAIYRIDSALTAVSDLRSTFGAIQNRFESTINNLSATSENLEASRSRIRDADFAAETADLTRAQILQQAGISVLAQANAVPQSVLALLQ